MSLRIDHFVLTVADIEATVVFYRDVLGMRVEAFEPSGGGGKRLEICFGDQKINLHPSDDPYLPHAKYPQPGSADFCLISELPLADWQERLEATGIAIEGGPVRRTGATGPILSIYLRDPDGNLVEISNPIRGAG